MSPLSEDLADLARNVQRITDFIRQCQAKEMTAADCAALRALVVDLEALVRTATESETHAP